MNADILAGIIIGLAIGVVAYLIGTTIAHLRSKREVWVPHAERVGPRALGSGDETLTEALPWSDPERPIVEHIRAHNPRRKLNPVASLEDDLRALDDAA